MHLILVSKTIIKFIRFIKLVKLRAKNYDTGKNILKNKINGFRITVNI